jgi:hypothetical protein
VSGFEVGGEPTHAIPPDRVAKLVEAKEWYDRRLALEETIRKWGGSAQRNQEDRDAIDREAATILEEIVEVIEETWGFARPLGGGG